MRPAVFVTGGAGLLGVTWAVTMRPRWAVTLGLHERQIALAGVQTRRTPLDSADDLSRAFEELQPSLVVHTAGMTNVEACEADPALARHVNADLAENVATVCARLAIPLAHISTDHMFANDGGLVDETEPASPVNVYGRSKAEGESRVLDAHPGAMVVRTNFYGWGPPHRRSFSDVILRALRRSERLNLFTDVTYTPILMESLITAVHELADRKASGVFNVTGDSCISKHEFGIRVARAFGLSDANITAVSIEDQKGLVTRPRRMGLSNRKATIQLGHPLGDITEQLAALARQESSAAVTEIQHL